MDRRERDLRRLVNTECSVAQATACSIERTGGGHFRINIETQSGGRVTIIHAWSPSDVRATRNLRSYIRRALHAHQ